MSQRLILASGSPQRTRLLDQLGIAHTAIAADIDETPQPNESAAGLAERLARGKAEARAIDHSDDVILGSDTVVALGERLYGKPANAAEADEMLASLAGRVHRVASAVAVCAGARTHTAVVVSHVTLRHISKTERAAYIASGEPMGKAGGYAIQGLGAMFVARLEGSYSAVMGLPLYETAELLRRVGIDALAR